MKNIERNKSEKVKEFPDSKTPIIFIRVLKYFIREGLRKENTKTSFHLEK